MKIPVHLDGRAGDEVGGGRGEKHRYRPTILFRAINKSARM